VLFLNPFSNKTWNKNIYLTKYHNFFKSQTDPKTTKNMKKKKGGVLNRRNAKRENKMERRKYDEQVWI